LAAGIIAAAATGVSRADTFFIKKTPIVKMASARRLFTCDFFINKI
jgi:hypothetical protein